VAKIAVIGSLNMDIIAVSPRLPRAGETIMGIQYLNEPGGKGANQAYSAAKLGGDVAMLGRVGMDDHGERMRANLAAVRCDVSEVRPIVGASGVAVIFVAQSGENSIVVVPGANEHYRPSDLRAAESHLADVQLVMLQLETPLETVIAAAQLAKRRGARVILDPAPAPASLSQELLRNVDILTPNETEATQLVGDLPSNLSLEDARVIAGKLRATGVKTVIIKLGSQGCLLAQGESSTPIASPRVDAIDSTAAGDVFNGALAVACSEGASLVDACRFAVRAAALSVTRLGAQRSMPNRQELEAFGE
jgi:ribokinase